MAGKAATKTEDTKKTAVTASTGDIAASEKTSVTEAGKKTATRKTAPKKTKAETAKTTSTRSSATKKTTAKKELKVDAYVEYYGKQVSEKEIVDSVRQAWKKSGHKIGDLRTMELYIKPEDGTVYYVINGDETGDVAF